MRLRRTTSAVTALLLAVGVALLGPASTARAATDNPYRGYDISWPECPTDVGIPGRMGLGKPMPPTTTGFTVIGLTNGPGFHRNPCIETHLASVRAHGIRVAAYAMTTFPTKDQLHQYGGSGPYATTTLLGRLSNAGVAEARFNVWTMRSIGFRTPIVWIDVEHYPPWDWTTSQQMNRAFLRGVVREYRAAGYRVGFYSSPYMWGSIIGTGGPTGYPEWRSAGARGADVAWNRCAPSQSFQGGRAVLAQWWDDQYDYDLVCGGFRTSAALARWFALT